MEKHFELTEEKNTLNSTLFRIKATIDIPKHDIRKGDLGGFVEYLDNLAEDYSLGGFGWVSNNGCVSGNARVSGNAIVKDEAIISDNSQVYGNTII